MQRAIEAARTAPSRGPAPLETATGLKNLQLLVQLRWIAVVGQAAAIAIVHFGYGIQLPLDAMLRVLVCLTGFNVASLPRWRRRRPVTDLELFVALLVDIGMLTVQLYLSGGATNPFIFLYLLQVILGAVLLETRAVWLLVAATSACVAGLALFPRPLALPFDRDLGLANPYIQGLLVCFALNAALLVAFITRIARNLRTRDAHLAALRQRAAEEEHIVRMGLLASGAAHELGTPLATLAVILGDWKRLPHFASDPELLQEIDEMQVQLQRCKSIVSGILVSAGEARGESSEETSLAEFLDGLVAEWRATRPVKALEYRNRFGEDLRLVSDSTLQQMICNVLDNALEASPQWVGLEASRHGDTLVLTVADRGPGFLPAMLAQFGKPYQSSKGRPGGGLGLFLVVNVARTLGGSVAARNRPEGGAEVVLTLPLDAIALDLDDEDPDAADEDTDGHARRHRAAP